MYELSDRDDHLQFQITSPLRSPGEYIYVEARQRQHLHNAAIKES